MLVFEKQSTELHIPFVVNKFLGCYTHISNFLLSFQNKQTLAETSTWRSIANIPDTPTAETD